MAGSVGAAGVGLLPQQHQLTSLVGQPFANLISRHAVYRVRLQYSESPSNSPSCPTTHSALVDASTLQIPTQTPQWPAIAQQPCIRPNLISLPLLNPIPALDLSRNPSTTVILSITQEQIAQESAGLPGVASNSGTLATNLSGIQGAMGNPSSMVPTAQDFERRLSSIANVKTTVTFLAESVTVANAAFKEQLARESLHKPIRITTPATSPGQQEQRLGDRPQLAHWFNSSTLRTPSNRTSKCWNSR